MNAQAEPFALHVTDEALTHFLDFYNPLVRQIRSRIGWFPMPTFTFGLWLAGLIALVVVLACLAPAVRRGASGTRLASYLLSAIMILNGFGHLGGSIYFQRWLPGTTSAPVLLIAGVFLVKRTWARRRAALASTASFSSREGATRTSAPRSDPGATL